MSSFVLKIIALISMFIDHTGYYLYGNDFSMLNLIGRFALPLFAFQLTEGFIHTKSKKKYAIRLLIFAIISELPYVLFRGKYIGNDFSLNVFFTLFLGFICIWIYSENNSFGVLSFAIISIIAELTKCDYGVYGITIIFLFYALKDRPIFLNIAFVIATICKYLFNIIVYWNTMYLIIFVLLCMFTIFPIIFINFYNKKEGPKMKYLFYIFYPLHLLVLFLL